MINAINEPIKGYLPDSIEKKSIKKQTVKYR